jgi:putative nucleotidyltransferase with HDIG domain
LLWTLALTHEPRRNLALPDDIDTSVVATTEIKAGFYFQTIDLQKTKEARDAAIAGVPDYYRVDRERVQGQVRGLRDRIDSLRQHREPVEAAIRAALLSSTLDQPREAIVKRAVAQYTTQLLTEPAWANVADATELALWLTPDLATVPYRVVDGVAENAAAAPAETDPAAETPAPEFAGKPAEALVDAGPLTFAYGERLADLAISGLDYVLTQGVRMGSLTPAAAEKRIVILRDVISPEQQVSTELRLGDVPSPGDAVDLLAARLRDTAKTAARESDQAVEWARLHEAALALATPEITDTIRHDAVYTAGAWERAREGVAPVMKEVYPGENIQEAGHRWTPQSRADVSTYLGLMGEEEPLERVLMSALAHLLMAALVLLCLHRAVTLYGAEDADDRVVEFNLGLLLISATLVVGRLAFYFEPSGFVLPVAATGILCAILVHARLASLVSLLTVLLVSAQYGYDWRLVITGLAMSLAGVFSIHRVRRRSDMAAASIKAALIGLLVIVAVQLATESLLSESALRRMGMIALNGGLCLLLVPGLLSPLERIFGITTDITLLEYSDLNNELLTQLAIRAPGTYAHSQMLGMLAEAAADAIGANGLKARVCAFYHDIGKMRRSEYFTENQSGFNIHDEIKPRQSARAIMAHVVQGAEMAKEYHLPRPIIDAILEHHGTCRIGFFFQQALEQTKHGDVREEDFRYPGPKPQSPETAILMVCDAAESGVRSIKSPTEERVREFIDNIIAARQADRQFDDCNLTLKQLDTIAETVTRRIMTSMHTRIAYPSANRDEDDNKDNIILMTGGAK